MLPVKGVGGWGKPLKLYGPPKIPPERRGRKMKVIEITLEYDVELLRQLLKEFGWDFEGMREKPHPVMTGDCNHVDPAASGDFEEGYYENAAWYCAYCYPGSNPARMEWSRTRGVIVIYAPLSSSKPARALALAYKRFAEKTGDAEEVQVLKEKIFWFLLKHF